MFNIITGTTHESVFEQILTTIKNRERNLNVTHMVVVPDRFTLSVESVILDNEECKGVLDVEVVTLNRLYNRLCKKEGFLDKSSACMILQGMVSKSVNFGTDSPELAEQIYDTIMQLKACRLEPNVFDGAGKLSAKFEGIKEIYSAYQSYLKSNNLIDPSDKLTALAKACSALNKNHVYFALFDSLTARHIAVIDKMSKHCLSVTVGALKGLNRALFTNDVFSSVSQLCKEQEIEHQIIEVKEPNIFSQTLLSQAYQNGEKADVTAPIAIRSFLSKEAELSSAAHEILREVRAGARFKDIAILCGQIDQFVLSETLSAYGISHYIDLPKMLVDHPLMRLVSGCLDVIATNYSVSAVETLLLSPYLGVTKRQREAFINYCKRCCISYVGFEPFNDEASEQARQAVVSVVQGLSGDIISNLIGLVNKVQDANLPNSSRAHSEVVALLNRAKEISWKGAGELCNALKAGAKIRLTAIPPTSDAVYVGVGENFRGIKHRLLLVLGANRGALPLEKDDAGLITDRDMVRLRAVGQQIEPMICEVNTRARYEFIHSLTMASRVVISYNADPSHAISYLTSIFGLNVQGGEQVEKHYKDSLDYLQYAFPTEQAVKKCIASSLTQLQSNINAESTLSDIDCASIAVINQPLLTSLRKETPFNGEALFFKHAKRLSVSKLEAYYSCPHRFFLQHGIRLKEQEEGGIKHTIIGNLLHAVVEQFVKGGFEPLTQAEIEDIFNRELAGIWLDPASKTTLRRLSQSANRLCVDLADQQTYTDYTTSKDEVEYSFTFKVDDLEIEGKIDRIDRNGSYVRIIDYKSGDKQLKKEDIYYGLSLQLAIYLKSLLIEGCQPAGAFYYPVVDSFDRSGAVLNGMVIDDVKQLIAMDKRHLQLISSPIIGTKLKEEKDKKTKKPTGVLSRNRTCGKNVFTEQQLEVICSYALKMAVSASDNMSKGKVDRIPLGECKFCPAKGYCTPARVREMDNSVDISSFEEK